MSDENLGEIHGIESSDACHQPAQPTLKDCIALKELLPVNKIDKTIEGISLIIYENDDLYCNFLQKTDHRINISKEDPSGDFIKCEYNRDGDSYRSPISNNYFPPQSDCKFPSKDLRVLEEHLNSIFKSYAKNYYSNTAISSVYCWDIGSSIQNGFKCAIMIRNSVDSSNNEGIWNSNNLLTVTFNEKDNVVYGDYHLTTTVMLSMGFENKICGKGDLSGTLTKTVFIYFNAIIRIQQPNLFLKVI